MNISKIFQEIENNELLENTLNKLFKLFSVSNLKSEQALSAFCQIALKDNSTINVIYKNIDLINDEKIKFILINSLKILRSNTNDNSDLLHKLFHRIGLNNFDIKSIVSMSLNPAKYSLELTIILNFIKSRGLSLENVNSLSIEMAKSGNIYDYRNDVRLDHRVVIRRYPTGGVSEKIALIMPSLLKCISNKYKFVSPFLVAKTLGFTGGTWDKLSCIPGFCFPSSGHQSISLLEKENVCMTVAKGDYAPSDTLLYQLRSITNTVNSLPLIILSIASKQIANPVDMLLLDIRYGKGAFLENLVLGI